MKTMNTIINSIMRNVAKYICAVILLIGFSTYAWGTVDEISGFGDCPWDFCTDCSDYSSGTFTSGTYTFVGTDVKDDSFFEELLLKKKTGALTLPVYNTAVTQIKLYAGAGSSMNDMTISIYVDGTLQTTTTMNNGNTDYGCGYTSRTLSVNYPAGSTITLKNEDKNEIVHLAKIEITHSGSTSGSGIPINKQYYNEGGSFTCTIGGNEVAKVTTGQTVTLTANPNPGYSLYGYTVTAVSRTCNKSYNPPITDYKEDISVTNNTFVVPDVSYFDYIIVEAMWDDCTPNDITINVASGSGSADVASNACEGETVTFTASPATGYQYAGAVVSGDNTYINLSSSQYSFTMPNEDVDIDVNFSAKTYTINLNGNGGMGHTPSVTATYGSHTFSSAITNPSRTGYTFGGWYSGSGGTGTMIINTSGTLQANTSFTDASGNWTHDGGTTLYAKWTANTISLTLDKNNNDASGSTSGTASVKYDATALESGTVHATRAGYVLEGYYAEQACTHKVITNTGALVNYTGYVVSGKWARATTPTTLYAKWTQLYTLAVANNANVADMTATPSGASAITEGNSSNVAGGTSVTLAHGAVTSPYTWAGWHVTKTSDGTDVTGTCVAGNTLTMPEYNVTVDAYVFADLIAFCEAEPEVTISGTIKVTSTNGKTVKAADVLQVSGTNLSTATITVASSSADFKLSSDVSGTFRQSITIDVVSNTIASTNIYVAYNPSETTDGINNTVVVTVKDDPSTPTAQASTTAGDIQGRHLPAKFIIAEKVGDDWYALPNNMGNNYTSSTTAVKLSSVNETTGVATFYSDVTDQFAYQLLASKGLDGKGMVFSSPAKSNNIIKANTTASTSTIGLYAQSGWNNGATPTAPYFEFTPTTSDLKDYTLKNTFQNNYLGITSGSWGIGASATVRFFSIDQHAAPTLTWKNDMIDGNDAAKTLATTKGENGVVVLPSLADDPAPCSAASSILTFDGWVTATWEGYKTTGYTKVNAGDAVTSNKKYYAVFKTSDNKYFTKCPTIQTVTYTANGGTGSDVVESYAMVSSSGTAVTLKDVGTGDGQINFTKEGYVFVGWTTSSNYGSEFKYAGNSVTVKPEDSGNFGNLTLSAVWVGALTITGDVHLTSTYTSAARSEANTVYTTANPNNLLTVSVAGVPTAIASNLKIRTSYLTSADETQAAATCPFRLCNDGSSNYNIVDGGNLNITSGDYSQTYAIGYKPGVDGGASGTTETYKLKLELINSGGDKVFSTAIKELHGRVLPTHFVIAAKINGQWCALPADLLTSSGTAIPDAYPITVNNDVTAAIAAPKKALYSASVRAHNDHRGGVRLVTATGDVHDGQLQATRSDNAYLWRTTSDCTTGMQEWYLVSNNFSTYEVRLDPTIKRSSTGTEDGGDGTAYVTRQLCVDGNKILFGTTSAKTMYILPVTNEYEPVEMQVVEWKADGIKFMYFGNPEYTAEVEIEGVNKASAQALGSALQIDHGVYEIAVSGLEGSAYKQMNIIIKNGATEVGRKAVTIPLIVNTETTIESARSTAGITVKANCSNVDLVVLNGGKLSSAETTDASQFTFKSITVYGGGKLIVPAGNYLTAKKMYLRAGSVTATTKGATPATSYSYVYPQVYVGSGSTLTINENIINFDYLTNYDQYFGVAFPHTAAINNNNITYPDDIYGSAAKTGSYLLRVFDSQIRATQGAVDNVWVDVETGSEAMPKQTNTIRGLGYYALFPPRKVSVNGGEAERQKYGIQRVKMSAESLSNEYADATIDVKAYPAAQPYNAGWWMLGNPYMANLNGGGVGDSDAAILVGKIGKNAQGQYEWQDKEVRYVTVPNDDASETYDQRPVSSYTFPAFKPFYVQVGANGRVTFTTTNRVVAAPSRFFNNEMPTEIETAIALNSEAYGDTTHILINNEFTAEYEVGDDLLKMPHANVSLFTISGTTDLFANALNAQLAAEGIPVGYTAPTEGQYTFSYNDKLSTAWIEHLWLIDYVQNSTIDLLESDYTFNATAETNKTRFVLKIELKSGKEDPTTSIDGLIETSPNEGPIKFIYQDKLYIRYNGIIYDAVGKKVK